MVSCKSQAWNWIYIVTKINFYPFLSFIWLFFLFIPQISTKGFGKQQKNSALLLKYLHWLEDVLCKKAKLYSLGKQIGLQRLPPGIAVGAHFPLKSYGNSKLARGVSQDNNSQSFPSPWISWWITFTLHIHGWTRSQIWALLRQAAGWEPFLVLWPPQTGFSPAQESISKC